MFEKRPIDNSSSNLFQPKILFAKQQSSSLRSCEIVEKRFPGFQFGKTVSFSRQVDPGKWMVGGLIILSLFVFFYFQGHFALKGGYLFKHQKRGSKELLPLGKTHWIPAEVARSWERCWWKKPLLPLWSPSKKYDNKSRSELETGLPYKFMGNWCYFTLQRAEQKLFLGAHRPRLGLPKEDYWWYRDLRCSEASKFESGSSVEPREGCYFPKVFLSINTGLRLDSMFFILIGSMGLSYLPTILFRKVPPTWVLTYHIQYRLDPVGFVRAW